MIRLRVKAFALFWFDFIIGDDWRVAVGVVLALALTYGLSHATSMPTWWLLPVVVVVLLPVSIHRAIRGRR